MAPEFEDDLVEARRVQSKYPVTLAAGPYGRPLHPLFVTIPIGAWSISFAFDLASRFASEEFVYSRAAFWVIGLGLIGGVAASATGALDLLAVPRDTKAFRTGSIYVILSNVVLVLFAISFLIRRGHTSFSAAPPGLLVLSAVALVLLAAAAWLWLGLTYTFGVRVADEATQRQAFELLDEPTTAPATTQTPDLEPSGASEG